MLDPTNKDNKDLPLTIRAVFIVGPDKKLKLSLNCKTCHCLLFKLVQLFCKADNIKPFWMCTSKNKP